VISRLPKEGKSLHKEKEKRKMGKWRDEPMNTGGAAAAPYQRAANDECRICGGEKRVSFLFAPIDSRVLTFYFPRKFFLSESLSLGADHFLSPSLSLSRSFAGIGHW